MPTSTEILNGGIFNTPISDTTGDVPAVDQLTPTSYMVQPPIPIPKTARRPMDYL